jgi:hypothetical protein
MPKDFGHATRRDLPILPNILFQIDHLDMPHLVWTVVPTDESIGGFQGTDAVASRMATNWTWPAVSVNDIAVGKTDSREG